MTFIMSISFFMESEYLFSIPISLNPSFFKTFPDGRLSIKYPDLILGESNFPNAYSNKYLLDSVA